MSKICQLSGKTAQTGNRVSHSKTKTNHRFDPNLQKKRLWSTAMNKFVTLRLSTSAIRTVDKIGFDAYVKRAGIKVN